MVMRNIINYRKQAYQKKGLFVYQGTTALVKGRGMCFDLDYLTTTVGERAIDAFGARGLKVIEKPSVSNNMAFAGVLTQNYPARTSGLQLVELALPGGCAMIAGIIATTINSTRLTCIVPSTLLAASGYTGCAGLWGHAGLLGKGTAIALQTHTDGTGLPWENDLVGNASYATATGTITATNLFTYAAVGDVVWILSGGIANAAHVGKFYIKTKTSVSAVIIASTSGGAAVLDAAANGAILAVAVVPAAEPLTLAYLCDGEESGLMEYDVPVNGATTNPMVGGFTNLIGAVTLAGAHIPPLVNGLFPGMKKSVQLHGLLTTGYYQITPAALGLAPDGTVVVVAELEDSLDQADLEWTGQMWDIKSVSVAAIAT